MKRVTKRVTSYLGCLVFVLGLGVTSLLSTQPASARPNPRRAQRTTIIRARQRPVRRRTVRGRRVVRPSIRRTVKSNQRIRRTGHPRRVVRRNIRRRPIRRRIIRTYPRYKVYPRRRVYPRYRVYPHRSTIIFPDYYRYRNRRYYRDRDHFRGYFWGSLAVGLIRDIIRTQGSTNTVIYQYTPQGTYQALPTSRLESYAKPILDFYGLEASRCSSDTVVLLLPNKQVVCAYPNSEVSEGFYEVHPDTWKLSRVYR